jgi:hypothetical protein
VGHFERQFDCRVRVLRTYGGGKYVNIDLFCERTGIARQRTEADNPASNGKAERMHRTVLNMARLHDFQLPVAYAILGRRRQICRVCVEPQPLRGEPESLLIMEMLEGKPPNLAHIVTFGSPCMVYRKAGKNSLKKRSQRGLILGVSEEVKSFLVYLMDDKVVTTQHVKYI